MGYNNFMKLILEFINIGGRVEMATESTRSWFQIRQQRPNPTKKGQEGNVKITGRPPMNDAPSNATKQKVAAAKQYIENHYKNQKKSLQERKERYVLRFRCVTVFGCT